MSRVKILFLLDTSGSMNLICSDAIGGFNSFIASQASLDGEAVLSLYQFSSDVKLIHDGVDIRSIPELTNASYVPHGATALYDAIGQAITDNMHEENVIIAILTDGEENVSRTYTYGVVSQLLKSVQEKKDWDVIFLGANIKDMAKFTGSLNIPSEKSIAFACNAEGSNNAFMSIDAAATSYRNYKAQV